MLILECRSPVVFLLPCLPSISILLRLPAELLHFHFLSVRQIPVTMVLRGSVLNMIRRVLQPLKVWGSAEPSQRSLGLV